MSASLGDSTSTKARPALSRRGLMGLGMVAALTGSRARATADNALPLSRSLSNELKLALSHGRPLLVMVSLQGCPFCHAVRQSHLLPLWHEQGLAPVQLDMRSTLTTQNFNGEFITHEQWIRAAGIKVAPTVLFFGPGGVEVAERLTGALLPDFYGAYLSDRLAQATSRLR